LSRFYLIDGTETPFPKMIQSEHALFFVRVLSSSTLDLTQISDANIHNQLTDPCSYLYTQKIGLQARKVGADLIRYFSARSQEKGINVAIDIHTIIQSEKPVDKVEYICQLDPKTGILRFSEPRTFPVMFTREQFFGGWRVAFIGLIWTSLITFIALLVIRKIKALFFAVAVNDGKNANQSTPASYDVALITVSANNKMEIELAFQTGVMILPIGLFIDQRQLLLQCQK
jgi:hypothetical protein